MNDMDAVCQVESVHPRQIQQVENGMMAEDSLFQLAELFKAIGDSTRIRILHALSISELCVCDLADLLHMSSSAISH